MLQKLWFFLQTSTHKRTSPRKPSTHQLLFTNLTSLYASVFISPKTDSKIAPPNCQKNVLSDSLHIFINLRPFRAKPQILLFPLITISILPQIRPPLATYSTKPCHQICQSSFLCSSVTSIFLTVFNQCGFHIPATQRSICSDAYL